MSKFEIYNTSEATKLERDKRWPLVYLLKNNKEIYIGETTNVYSRLFSHTRAKEKSTLTDRYIIRHNQSNKSSAYLLESDLINRAFADGTYELVNTKMQTKEVHEGHEFFGKEEFKNDIKDIWDALKEQGIFKKEYDEIENGELFKYSPWKLFDDNQLRVIKKVKNHITKDEKSFVNGSAGTGKTLLIIRIAMDYILENDDDKVIGIFPAKKGNHMTFNRVLKRLGAFYKKRIKVIPNLNKDSLDKIDYLLIDEAQRLRKWFRGQGSPSYFRDFEMEECKNEIDWIESNEINYSLFYDINQSFHRHDIDLVDYIGKNQYELISQYRMKAGEKWIQFVKELLQIVPETDEIFDFNDYEFDVFNSQLELFNKVKEMNDSKGNWDNKSRMVASLNIENGSWKTQRKFDNLDSAKSVDYSNVETEFNFGNYKAVWNKLAHYSDWLEKSDISEVGCVHTVQGRDFRYVGIIFGDDIVIENGVLKANNQIKNSYFILLTRGMHGHGLYIENPELKSYIKNIISKRVKK